MFSVRPSPALRKVWREVLPAGRWIGSRDDNEQRHSGCRCSCVNLRETRAVPRYAPS